jgi:hypothetical protein
LKEEAILVEYDNIDEAMEVINKSKAVKDVKKYIFGNEIY